MKVAVEVTKENQGKGAELFPDQAVQEPQNRGAVLDRTRPNQEAEVLPGPGVGQEVPDRAHDLALVLAPILVLGARPAPDRDLTVVQEAGQEALDPDPVPDPVPDPNLNLNLNLDLDLALALVLEVRLARDHDLTVVQEADLPLKVALGRLKHDINE